jgi:hypothetical protein
MFPRRAPQTAGHRLDFVLGPIGPYRALPIGLSRSLYVPICIPYLAALFFLCGLPEFVQLALMIPKVQTRSAFRIVLVCLLVRCLFSARLVNSFPLGPRLAHAAKQGQPTRQNRG